MEQHPSLLNTKLYCPKQADGIILRDRLHQQLDQSLRIPLTLISAPPGYGKTVLASSWARVQQVSVSWLLLDQEESRFPQFLAYLIAALEGTYPGGFATASVLSTSELPSVNRIAQLLVNDINAVGEDVVVIIDDYHQIDHGSVVHELMELILKYPPPNLHLIILTRRDPPFTLNKLRANNQVLDIRLAELRFRIDETTSLLTAALARELSDAAVTNVQNMLEGWGAGIRMVSLAVQRMTADDYFLQHLSGNIQQIQEYMFDEVIDGVGPATLCYLMCSALPQRFSASLLDAMVSVLQEFPGNIDGAEFIHFVEHGNMFTSSLDAHGEWYRYHNLFRELLLQRIERTMHTEDLAAVIRAASEWLEQHGHIDDAIRILVSQGLYDKAAGIVERHCDTALNEDQWLVLESWLQKFLPAEMHRWPALLLAKASLAVFNFDIYLVADIARQLEVHHLKGSLSPGQLGKLNFFQAVPRFWSGDITAARELLEQAVQAPLALGQIAGEVYIYYSMACTLSGDLDFAIRVLDKADVLNGGQRNIFTTRLLAARSYIYYISLQPANSLGCAERLALLAVNDIPSDHVSGWAHYLRALNLFNTGRLEAARQAATEALQYAVFLEKRVVVELHLIAGISSTYLSEIKGVTDAFASLKALADTVPAGSDVLALVQSAVVRLTLIQGDFPAAQHLAAELAKTPSAGTLVFWLEEPSLTWAKVQLLAGSKAAVQQALPLLDELDRQTAGQHLLACQVEILLMQAIAHWRLEKMDPAQQTLEQAIALALPHNWTGPFTELADGIHSQLLESLQQEEHQAFIQQAILVRSDYGVDFSTNSMLSACGITPDQFTNRERDILELLAVRCQNKEIANKLYISTNTVNYHLKHIYQKLEVLGRRKAVTRAIELGLLPQN